MENIFSMKQFSGINVLPSSNKHGWSGKDRILYIKNGSTVMTHLHEAFHHLLCEADRFKYDDFGLGIGANTIGFGPIKRVLDQEDADDEEMAVCLMVLLTAKALGLNEKIIAYEMDLVSMDDMREGDYWNAVAIIEERDIKRFGFEIVLVEEQE